MPAILIRLPEVLKRYPISRAGLYVQMARNEFPRPIPIGLRAVAWDEQEIDAWIELRRKQSRAEQVAA